MAKYMSRTAYNQLPPERRVLVALMNNRRDFAIARDQHWYRIPVKSAPRGIDSKYIAFIKRSLLKMKNGLFIIAPKLQKWKQ